jgi:2-hydroxychromene-2-carboxylate isomerase
MEDQHAEPFCNVTTGRERRGLQRGPADLLVRRRGAAVTSRRVDFYFDYLSGYAYFGWLRIQEICDRRAIELSLHPVLFAALLNHWGSVGPAEVPPRRAWVYRDGFRYAALNGIELACPKFHPFNPLLALRMSLSEVAGSEQRRVVKTLFDEGWGKGIDIGSKEELVAALNRAGLDGTALASQAEQDSAKRALRRETDAALDRGVFGVPTMIVGDELFWGSDRMDHLELHLDGKDPLDPNRGKVREVLDRPRAADRRGKRF